MKKWPNRIAAAVTLVVLFGCASNGFLTNGSLADTEISAMAALGRMDEALSGPLFEGDGGKDIRLAVLEPELRGAAASDVWLPVYVQGLLHSILRKYSAMTLIDRQNLNQIITEQDLAANGRFSESDFISLGNLTNAEYFLTGTVQKLPGGEFSVSLSITGSGSGESRASFMGNGTAEALQNGTLINGAVEDLLSQLGVELTETGRRSLVTGRYMAAQAEVGFARGLAAQQSGAAVEALLNYSQAAAFDPSQLESLTRLGSVSSEISGGSVSANILNDIQARNTWVEVFREVAAFFNSHLPFEITYDPNLVQIGTTDYAKNRVELGMWIRAEPSAAGFTALNSLIEGLEKTGKREAWGFAGWPLRDIRPRTTGTVLFPGVSSFSFAVQTALVNERGKVIARGSITLKTKKIGFKAGDASVQAPEGALAQVVYPKVNAQDLTPTLTVVIAGVNGMTGREISETGYMRIAPGDIGRQLLERGDAYADKKDYDRAIEEYTQAILLDPDNAYAYHSRGDAYYWEDDYDRAIADYDQAIRLDPDNAYAYHSRGDAYYWKDDYDRAIADYDQAIRLNPDEDLHYSSRGKAYQWKDDYDRAIADYTQAIRLNPDEDWYYHSRGDAYYAKKDYDRAITDYTQAIRLNPDEDLHYSSRGDAYQWKDDYDRAIADYTQAIRLNPDDAYAYYSRGKAYHWKDDYDRAIADYEQALRIDPGHTRAKNNLENARKARGR
ncbi:MAG: tetratricopeptide repeat protein [Spirochaetaceae bacterium]|jgi:tetratricopeptide (TPR) repeat protein|nr:tetratricopeptide repeat protein [Spirochaetaceae bacterium]